LLGHDVVVRRRRFVGLKNGTLERKERFEERLETFRGQASFPGKQSPGKGFR
jgi:hypothetical protein